MDDQRCFRVNQPAVLAEVVDREAVIVNLDSGAYYSLRGDGADIWELLACQLPVARVISIMQERYPVAGERVAQAISALVTQLEENILLMPVQEPGSEVPALEPVMGEFSPPLLEKFTDMADLLLLDPIHEVDEQGWPHQPKAEG